MKKQIIIALICLLSLSGCGVLNRNWNTEMLATAAGQALVAANLSDAQVAELSAQTVAQMDAENKVNTGAYDARLRRIMNGIDEVNGLKLNFKVYETQEVNAFACGDGSIRVYSGLMDVMDDNEVMAIIGHEIGHVVHQDTKTAMKNAYLSAAARNAIGAAGGVAGALATSVVGEIADSFVSSQFSQKQEFNADEYGYQFSTEHGMSPYSMYSALNKLLDLSSGTQASLVQKMFSSHPDTAIRAQRMKEKADAYTASAN